MKEIKKLDGISVAKLYATIMLFPAALMVGLSMVMMNLKGPEGGFDTQTFGIVLAYPLGGFIAGLIGSVFYNIAAKMVGGIKLEFKRS